MSTFVEYLFNIERFVAENDYRHSTLNIRQLPRSITVPFGGTLPLYRGQL